MSGQTLTDVGSRRGPGAWRSSLGTFAVGGLAAIATMTVDGSCSSVGSWLVWLSIAVLIGFAVGVAVNPRIWRLVGVEAIKVLGGRTLLMGVLSVAAVTGLAAWLHEAGREDTAWTVSATAFSAGLWGAEIFLGGLRAAAGGGGRGRGPITVV